MKILNAFIRYYSLAVVLVLLSSAQKMPDPVLQSAALPQYPALARAARISGDVRLEFTLNEKGEVISVSTIEGHPMLKGMAEANVATWKFQLPQGLFRTEWKYETTFRFRFSDNPGDYDSPKLTVVLDSFHSVEITTDAPSDRYAEDCPSGSEKQAPSTIADDDFVEISRSGCYGTCPAYSVRVAASGQVSWKGFAYVAEKGEKLSTIQASEARALIGRFLAPQVWALCNRYSRSITDSATTTTHVMVGGREKTISNYAESASAWLNEFENSIDAVSNSHRWRHGEPLDEPLWGIFQDTYLPKPGVTRLMIAAANADIAKMEEALKSGDSISALDASGWSALMYAAASSHSEPVQYLLRKGADPNHTSPRGDTPLMASAISRQFDHDLYAAGAHVDAQNSAGRTALMILAASGEADEVKSALSAGADPSLHDVKGRTALDYLRLANCGKSPLNEYQMSEGGRCDHLDQDDVKVITELLKRSIRVRK